MLGCPRFCPSVVDPCFVRPRELLHKHFYFSIALAVSVSAVPPHDELYYVANDTMTSIANMLQYMHHSTLSVSF